MNPFGLKSCLQALEYSWNRVGSYTSIMLLLLLSFGYLYIRNDKNEKAYFVYPGLFYLLVLLNPFMEWMLVNRLGFEARVHRFFWIIPITFILAYVCLELCKGRREQGVFLLAFIMVLWFAQGRTPLEEGHYRTKNIYKIEDEVIELSEMMHELDDSESFRVYINEIHPNYTVRQYDPAFVLIDVPRGIEEVMSNPQLKVLGETQTSTYYVLAGYFYGRYQMNMDALYNSIKNTQIEYLILNYEEKELVTKRWIEFAAKTGHYYIYKVL